MAHVVVIDDELSWRTLHEQTLTEAGHDVTTFASGDECMRRLGEHSPELLVLDLRMYPTGRDMLLRLKRKWPRLPVIIYSAYDGYRDDPDFAKATAFVGKTGDPARLVDVVGDVLQNAAAMAGEDGLH
jgi:DNA-binding NtrC family response regulator